MACSGPEAQRALQSRTSPPASPSATPVAVQSTYVPPPIPSPSPPARGDSLPLGQTRTGPLRSYPDSPTGRVTVFAFKMPDATSGPQPDSTVSGKPSSYVWASIDAQICIAGPTSGYSYSDSNFVLTYADSTRIDRSHVKYSNFPDPQFPCCNEQIYEGDCVRGWITYAVPGDPRPTAVAFTGAEGPTISMDVVEVANRSEWERKGRLTRRWNRPTSLAAQRPIRYTYFVAYRRSRARQS